MATKKKAAKPAPKKPAKPAKKVAKPAPKKAAKPAPKKAAKPAPKKAAKPAPKKAVAKTAPTKAQKPAPKKAVASVKPASKPIAKPAAKPVAKPAAVEAKPASAPAPKAPVKPSAPAFKPGVSAKATIEQMRRIAREQAKKEEAKKAAKPQPVVIPKLSTQSAKKYEPHFTKSILDKPATEPSGPTMRYSDAELAEFRELINKKLDAAKKELAYLQGLITRKDDMSGDETDNRYMTMEDGSLSMEREQLSQMASRQYDFIDKLEKALMRIENKTYGICRVTGKLIDKARLRAVPHATLSMEAKMGFVKPSGE
jgi:RNA polymerase-binding transcription factor DksA